ncbi:MAPEG family protein [Granulosicoccus sp.]|nr:MAPEG family protein [Granulosicoccus sp.]
MAELQITSVVTSILALIMLPLTVIVTFKRIEIGKQSGNLTEADIGDYPDDGLKRRRRAFGNFVEYVPMCLIMLALMETAQGKSLTLWVVGIALIVGRVIHIFGTLFANNPLVRASGMMLTYIAFVTPALFLMIDLI